MKKILKKLINHKDKNPRPDIVLKTKTGDMAVIEIKNHIDPKVLERGAEDFATRFEGVMKELSNG